MLWNPYQFQTRSYKILEYPTRFYGILDKNALESISISKQDPTRFYGILDKNAMETISIANKILEDPARSYKIVQDATRFYGIVDKNPMESISIAHKILQDSTGY